MNDAEIMVILIYSIREDSGVSSTIATVYVCKHLTHLFPRLVSYNRFVELERYTVAVDHFH